MAEVDGLDGFTQQTAALEKNLGGAEAMAGAFNEELGRMREGMLFTGREVNTLTASIGRGLRNAFDGLIFEGMKLEDALKSVAQTMVDSVYAVAMKPVQNAFGGAIATTMSDFLGGMLPFAKGGAFAQGKVMPFAKGGVVSSPTNFPMRGATGLMGEAGPEAIMPLTRTADGRLGVKSNGGGRTVNVVMNITTPDTAGFARSQSQIAAQINRVLARGNRNS